MEKNEKNLVLAFRIIVGLIVVVGIVGLVFWVYKPTHIVDGFDCSKHQKEIVSLCKDNQNCVILDKCMEYYNEYQLSQVAYALNDSQGNISEMNEELE